MNFSLAEEVKVLLGPIILIQLVTSGIVICLGGYALIVMSDSANAVIAYTSYLMTIVVQLIMLCIPGELLMKDSIYVGDVVYRLPWYLMRPEMKRDLSFVICRSHRHCHVSAAGFKTISMQTLTEVKYANGLELKL